MNKIEQVARAMMATTNIPEHNDIDKVSMDWTGTDLWSCDFEEMATAAIEAMVGLTEDMLLACFNTKRAGGNLEDIHNAMIKAALEEK